MAPTPDDVVRQWFKEVWDEGREEAIDRLMAPNGVVHGLTGPGGPSLTGPAAFRPVFNTFREALGDLQIEIERTLVQGDTVAAFCRVRRWRCRPRAGCRPSSR